MPCLAAPRSRLDPLPDAPSARWLCHHHSSAASSRPPVAFDRRTGFSVSLTTSGFPHLASFPCSSPSPTSFLSLSFISNATPNIEGDQQTADDSAMESLPRMITSKYEIELRERILGGEFSVSYTKSKTRETRQLLMRWGKFGRRLAFVLINWERRYLLRQAQKVPEAKGNVRSITGQPFFIPLYDLYLTYGGIFRLTFGPKSFLIISDPVIAKHLLKDNSKAYSKGILAEILDFVMGKGLIPADGEVWRVRRRAIVPALHRKWLAVCLRDGWLIWKCYRKSMPQARNCC